MKILYLGTGPFAVPTLHRLHASEHDLLGVVTKPTPANLRRRQKPPPNPMRDAAAELGLDIYDPENINDDSGLELLENLSPDLLMVCDYGKILSKAALSAAKLGGINLHGSLLPKYRGAAPVHWAIYNGDAVTGVSVIHMTPKLDGGPLLATTEIPIGIDETMPELEHRMAEVGADAVIASLKKLESWDGTSVIGEIQDAEAVTQAPRLTKAQGEVDWNQSAVQIRNQIRAFQPWPGSYTWLHNGDSKPLRLVLGKASLVDPAQMAFPSSPGSVRVVDQRLCIQTGDGGLAIELLQPAGKKMMPCEDMLRGLTLNEDASVGAESTPKS